MTDLIAQGEQRSNRWRRPLPTGQAITLGRSAGTWSTPWDDRISRRHVQLIWKNGSLTVLRLAAARNPVFHDGKERDRFDIQPGEHFVIGRTTFSLADERINISI